jgi:hypothetical protein
VLVPLLAPLAATVALDFILMTWQASEAAQEWQGGQQGKQRTTATTET